MEEHPKLHNRDWRLHAVTTTTTEFRSPSGLVHPAGTTVELAGFLALGGETFGIPVPDASAMFLSLASRAAEGGRSLKELLAALPNPLAAQNNLLDFRRVEHQEPQFIDSVQNLLATVVFSHTAIEAYANLIIPAEHVYQRDRSDNRCTELYNRSQIERHISLPEKLHSVLPPIRQVPSPKGTALWQRFVALERLRDRIIHLKRDDWRHLDRAQAGTSLWSALAAPDVPDMYKTALSLIDHFTPVDKPRWLQKFIEMTPIDGA